MNHQDHVNLLRAGVADIGGNWADLGAGDGAFTLALAELVGPTATIVAVDKDRKALERQANAVQRQFPNHNISQHRADFSRKLTFQGLDGIVIANALHFVRRRKQVKLLAQFQDYLGPAGRLLIVEYGTDNGNMWVPYPFSYPRFAEMATEAGYHGIRKLSARPSRFLGEIYSAIAYMPTAPVAKVGKDR